MAQVPVKSEVSYEDFGVGRMVISALHKEDVIAGWVIGYVEDASIKAADEIITDAEYEILKLEIQAYNAALPVVELAPSRISILRIKVGNDTATLSDMRELYRLEHVII